MEDDASNQRPAALPRVVSLIVLLGVVLLVTILFFRVMAGFLVPLFLAAVLAVVFKPVHEWMVAKMPGRPRLAALGVTSAVALLVIVPTMYFGWRAFVETKDVIDAIGDKETFESIVSRVQGGVDRIEDWVKRTFDEAFAMDVEKSIRGYLSGMAGGAVRLGLVSIQALVSVAIGVCIMVFALYYFFADGPGMIETLTRLSPLDDEYERELLDRFSSVSRAVVLATILSAVVQGLLAGVGYFFALESGAPIFLLTVLTMLLAIVPFVGATAVWIPVALWLFFVQNDGFWAGVGMTVYGTAVVSSIDNVIKPYVLHGQSNLHPLLALLSVLGGIQLLGPIGILVGPMLVAFLQALLEMLRKELDQLDGPGEVVERLV